MENNKKRNIYNIEEKKTEKQRRLADRRAYTEALMDEVIEKYGIETLINLQKIVESQTNDDGDDLA